MFYRRSKKYRICRQSIFACHVTYEHQKFAWTTSCATFPPILKNNQSANQSSKAMDNWKISHKISHSGIVDGFLAIFASKDALFSARLHSLSASIRNWKRNLLIFVKNWISMDHSVLLPELQVCWSFYSFFALNWTWISCNIWFG